MKTKFLGICILIAAIIISGTLLYTSFYKSNYDRYKVAGAKVFDALEGEFVESTIKVEPTIVKEKIHIDMDEINKLLNMRINKEYLTPINCRKLDAYYCTQLNIWAEQYNDDKNSGKINNYSKYDIESIESGNKPRGTYKQGKPFWYDELPINVNVTNEYIIDK